MFQFDVNFLTKYGLEGNQSDILGALSSLKIVFLYNLHPISPQVYFETWAKTFYFQYH